MCVKIVTKRYGIKLIKNMNKQTDISYGCDNCGFALPVTRAKKHFPMNKQWKNVWLCDDCIEIIKRENKKMRGGE